MIRRGLVIALVAVVGLALVVSLRGNDHLSKPVMSPTAARDTLWVNAMLKLCQEPDVVLDDAQAEATAQGIVDRGGSGQGVRALTVFTCYRILKEIAGQDFDQLFPKTRPLLPPGCVEAIATATASKPGSFTLCSR